MMRRDDNSEPDVRAVVRQMVATLGWEQFYTPRNLALSILLEASELLQKVQWKTDAEISEFFSDIHSQRPFLLELADININLLALCDSLSIDLDELTLQKCQLIIDRTQDRVEKGSSRNDLICLQCNKPVNIDWVHCAHCGTRLIDQP